MLVLSRKVDEQVSIQGGVLTIKVLSIRGDKVRLGFIGPKEITIHRKEVQDAIEAKNLKTEPIK